MKKKLKIIIKNYPLFMNLSWIEKKERDNMGKEKYNKRERKPQSSSALEWRRTTVP